MKPSGWGAFPSAVGLHAISVWSLTALSSAFAATGPGVPPDEPRRVLIVESFSRDFDPLNTFTAAFKTELARNSLVPIEFYEASLGTGVPGDLHTEEALQEYLRALYADRPPDLVVPAGSPAARFWWRHRDDLFPEAPAVIAPIGDRVLSSLPLGTNATAVTFEFDARGAVENILEILPETKRIAVVLGDSPVERFWAAECRRLWEPYADRIQFLWFDKLPFDEICRRAAALPPQSAILYTIFFVDATGVPYEQAEALNRLSATVNAPIFGVFEQHLGHGLVGGVFISGERLGREAARVAARILMGEKAGAIPPEIVRSGLPTYDWRQLQRWNISEARLPRGSVVSFRPPSVWERYRWHISIALAIMILQAVTILALVLQRARRCAAEASARELAGRLIAGQEEERRRIARELHDDLNQRLSLLAVELDLIRRGEGPSSLALRIEATAQQAKDLSSEIHKLSYQLHPAKLDQLGLVAAARAFCHERAVQSGLSIGFADQNIPRDLPAETALCVFRVLQEALGNALRHGRATEVNVALSMAAGSLRLTVSDNGAGFDPARVRSKRGLGLFSMEERARLLHGKIAIRTAPGRGTRVQLTVPGGGA